MTLLLSSSSINLSLKQAISKRQLSWHMCSELRVKMLASEIWTKNIEHLWISSWDLSIRAVKPKPHFGHTDTTWHDWRPKARLYFTPLQCTTTTWCMLDIIKGTVDSVIDIIWRCWCMSLCLYVVVCWTIVYCVVKNKMSTHTRDIHVDEGMLQ